MVYLLRTNARHFLWASFLFACAAAAAAEHPSKDHWAFQAPIRPAVPAVKNKKWVRNPIDAFVLARLEREKIKISA